jgi:hypothetical protein
MFEITTPSSKGITAQPIILKTKANQGASEYKSLLIPEGKIISLQNNFKPSAKACNKPK